MDVTDIKSQNIKRILNVLRTSGGTTKNEISAITGLSFSTVSNLCNELKYNNVLVEEKISNSTVGRIPRIQIFNCAGFASVCIDFQEEGILNYSISNFAGESLYRTHFDISKIQDISTLIKMVDTTCNHILQQFADIQIVGVGISVPGIYDEVTRLVINSAIPVLNNVPLKELLTQALRLPCYIENESNLCALSIQKEYPEVNNIVYLHSSTGLGVGIICEGVLLRGKNGYAAEVAHIPLGTPDAVCSYCGNKGCIENDLAQRGMEILRSSDLNGTERISLIQDRAEKLGILLSLLTNLFDPDILCIGGIGFDGYTELEATVLHILEQRSPLNMKKGLKLIHDTDSLRAIEQGITQVIYHNWDPLKNVFQL